MSVDPVEAWTELAGGPEAAHVEHGDQLDMPASRPLAGFCRPLSRWVDCQGCGHPVDAQEGPQPCEAGGLCLVELDG